MNLLHRKYVARIADTGSIHKPDKKLHAALPNLSQVLKGKKEGLRMQFFRPGIDKILSNNARPFSGADAVEYHKIIKET